MKMDYQDHGSVCIMTPKDDEARAWVEEHIPDDAQWFGEGFVVEPRYVADIAEGFVSDGGKFIR